MVFAATPGQTILNNISFSLQAGQSLAIVGPVGAGITVLLRALLAEIAATADDAVFLSLIDQG